MKAARLVSPVDFLPVAPFSFPPVFTIGVAANWMSFEQLKKLNLWSTSTKEA